MILYKNFFSALYKIRYCLNFATLSSLLTSAKPFIRLNKHTSTNNNVLLIVLFIIHISLSCDIILILQVISSLPESDSALDKEISSKLCNSTC